jgi:hypothetical protein
MARRYTGHMNGERYLGNVNKMEVHDSITRRRVRINARSTKSSAVVIAHSTRSLPHTQLATTTAAGASAAPQGSPERKDAGPRVLYGKWGAVRQAKGILD